MRADPSGWSLDDWSKDLIIEAIRRLSDVCDGATSTDARGFNGADARFGKSLAELRTNQWTAGRYYAAWKMLGKYALQLQGMGIDYFYITAVADPMKQAAPHAVAEVLEVDAGPFTADDFHRMDTLLSGNLPPVNVSGVLTSPAAFTSRTILGPGGHIASKLPGYEHRPEQLDLAELIERAMDEQRNAITEAGTGTGKSMAYLVPAITASYADPNGEGGSKLRTIISTADKALQGQIWQKDIPFLQSVMPKPFKAALLKGRSNYLCLYQLEQTTTEAEQGEMFEEFEAEPTGPALEQLPEVLAWATTTETGDLEELPFLVSGRLRQAVAIDSEGCLSNKCPFFKRCWAERAKNIAKDADVIIVNHALLLRDLSLRLGSGGAVAVLPDADYVVIDEAHHIEEIATDAFGKEATIGMWARIAAEWKRLTTGHHEIAGRLDEVDEEVTEAKRYAALIETFGPNVAEIFDTIADRMAAAKPPATVQLLGDERPMCGATFEALGGVAFKMGEVTPYWLKDEADRVRWGKLAGRIMEFSGVMLSALTPAEHGTVVRYAEASGTGRFKRTTLYVKPIDVSEVLRDGLFECGSFRAVIATSATIATEGVDPFAFWRSRVGCDSDTDLTLQVGSPFDYPHHSLLYLPQDGRAFDPTQSRQDGSLDYLNRLADEYERLILESDGRAFALFTSNRTLNEVYMRLSPRLSKYLVLRQGDMPRGELVRQFKEHGQAVLFGVKSFWEGVDVQGAALSLVIIDKLPFAPPDDPIWSARKDAITAKTGDSWAWFHLLAIPNTIIQLKQGFGRLIRTKDDRGVVAILDGRLSTKQYGPRVIRALPPATVTRSHEAVRAFYGG